MYFSKGLFTGASFLLLYLVFNLGTCASDEKPKKKYVTLTCQTTPLDVNTNEGVTPADVYVCPGSTLTWTPNGHKFVVIFKRHQCPFVDDPRSCGQIDQDHPTSSSPVKDFPKLTVFDYEIVVDGVLFDPHVVGGGGHSLSN